MEQKSVALPQRNVGDLLNQTFAVYGRRLALLVATAALVQVPATLLIMAMPAGTKWLVPGIAVSLLANSLVYGAIAHLVGQHYVVERPSIRAGYAAVWGRIASLTTLTALLASLTIAATLATLFTAGLGALAALPAVLVASVYWTVAVPALVVERFKARAALGRSYRLVRGSWWRVLGILLAFGLVALGLGVVLSLGQVIATLATSAEPGTFLFDTLEFVGTVVAVVGVSPVIGVSGTLLYYDLRVRKEGFDLSTLLRETVAVPAGPGTGWREYDPGSAPADRPNRRPWGGEP